MKSQIHHCTPYGCLCDDLAWFDAGVPQGTLSFHGKLARYRAKEAQASPQANLQDLLEHADGEARRLYDNLTPLPYSWRIPGFWFQGYTPC